MQRFGRRNAERLERDVEDRGVGLRDPDPRRMDGPVDERGEAEVLEQPGQAAVEIRDDPDAQAAGAKRAQRPGGVGENPPRGRLRKDVEQLREAPVELRRRGPGSEGAADDRVPPCALVIAETNRAGAGKGEGRGGGQRGPEAPHHLRGCETDAVPCGDAGIGRSDRLGHLEERACGVESDGAEGHRSGPTSEARALAKQQRGTVELDQRMPCAPLDPQAFGFELRQEGSERFDVDGQVTEALGSAGGLDELEWVARQPQRKGFPRAVRAPSLRLDRTVMGDSVSPRVLARLDWATFGTMITAAFALLLGR